jgi:glycosyltransferase involved in cell wall biosynthesis
VNALSVVIPSRNADNLAACVNAVWQHDPCLRIIVVDDGVDWNRCIDLAPSQAWGAVMDNAVPGQKPFVFARNANIGIRAAGTDDVILLNDDALLTTYCGFSEMQRRNSEELALVGAVTNLTGQPLQRPMKIGVRPVLHFAFVCVLIPRAVIDTVGLLDERYCLDYGVEDRDYCEACQRAGVGVYVDDACFVDHSKLTSTFRGHPESPKSFVRNYELFRQKWGIA